MGRWTDRETRSRPDRSLLSAAKEKKEIASPVFAEMRADMEKLGIRHIGRPLSMVLSCLLLRCFARVHRHIYQGPGGLMPRAKEQPNAGVHPCAGRCGAGSQWPDRGTTQSAMMLSTSYHPVCGPVHACWHGGNCPMRSLPRPPLPSFLSTMARMTVCNPYFVTALVVHVSHVCVYACRSPQGTTQS